MTRSNLRPPVVVLPLPSPEMLRIRTVLCQRSNVAVRTVRSTLRAPMIVRIVVAVARALTWPLRKLVRVPRRRIALAVEGARPPPLLVGC